MIEFHVRWPQLPTLPEMSEPDNSPLLYGSGYLVTYAALATTLWFLFLQ